MAAAAKLMPLAHWLAGQGLSGADLEAKGDLLVVRLPAESRGRLLGDEALRREAVSRAQALGFSRIALDLPL